MDLSLIIRKANLRKKIEEGQDLWKARSVKYYKRERKGNRWVYYYTKAEYTKVKDKAGDGSKNEKEKTGDYAALNSKQLRDVIYARFGGSLSKYKLDKLKGMSDKELIQKLKEHDKTISEKYKGYPEKLPKPRMY